MNNVQPPSSSFRQELKLIPAWAMLLAVVLFTCMVSLFWLYIPRQPNPPPPAFYIPMGAFVGILLGAYGLLVGYVNVDSGRRGMNRTAWTLLAAFVPNALGFILYFLMRQPIREQCPGCGAIVQAGFNYCPNCNFELNPHCPKCQHPVQASAMYCPYCGNTMPVRPSVAGGH